MNSIKVISAVFVSMFLVSVGTVRAADEKHMTIGLWAFPPAAGNPYTGTTVPPILTLPAMFDGLTRITRSGEVLPSLATSWHKESETTWVFNLRPNVSFSNGESFTADAVVAAFAFLRSDQGQTVGASREVADVIRVDARDALTVVLETAAPAPLLPRRVVPVRFPAPEHWAALGPQGFAQDPVGTGPFKVESWGAGRIELSAFRGSWRPPILDRLTLQMIPDQASRIQALQSEGIDIATSISADDRDAVASIGGRMMESPSAGVAVISFITTKPGPLQDKRVRQALNYAVNKDIIVELLMGGATVVASQPVPEGAFGYDPSLKPYPYDPDKARSLLTDAGYSDGFELTIEVTTGAGVNSDSYYAMVADDLRRVGIDVTLQTIPSQILVRRIYDGSWEGQAFAMSMDTMPSLDALRPFRLHSCLWSSPWHCNSEDTPLIKAAMAEGDLGRREAMVRSLLRRYHDDPPALYMFQMVGFTGLAPRVKNFSSDYGVYNFHAMDLEIE
ncbi:MAG: ABC transporter substrate-binding protein [Rhodospirillaceae bacterium]|jgi:peptide/nickel transport system substrate-binding protein|nr:ABC transporter substrate-binding protein [Rhodospirillaceae bacterium]MBT5566680.1 ABC transporter substrate-binding protein [Rhodospirillaceae bacterium]MBT6090480.1 ABC transporter substrate-binding protein [Rhodospirillaceae bacterium]